MLDVLLHAFEQAGAPVTSDVNGTTSEGVAFLRMNARNGLRAIEVGAVRGALRRCALRSNQPVPAGHVRVGTHTSCIGGAARP